MPGTSKHYTSPVGEARIHTVVPAFAKALKPSPDAILGIQKVKPGGQTPDCHCPHRIARPYHLSRVAHRALFATIDFFSGTVS